MWYNTFDAAFWITLTTIITGSTGLAIRYCLKSKCNSVDCCFGLISIQRDTRAEQEEEIAAMELGINRNISQNNINTS